MKTIKLLIIALLSFVYTEAQTILGNQQVIRLPDQYSLVKLPEHYDPSKAYPLLVSIPGQGEMGISESDLPKMFHHGIAMLISKDANYFGDKFICVSLLYYWQSSDKINRSIETIQSMYNVDPDRIYMTGLSLGAGKTWEYAEKYPNKLAAIVTYAPAFSVRNDEIDIVAKAGIHAWSIHNTGDGTVSQWNTVNSINEMNKVAPGSGKMTLINASGHNCWTAGYNGNIKMDGLNMYDWLLQFSRDGKTVDPPPVTTDPPVVTPPPPDEKRVVGTITLFGRTITIYDNGTWE